MAKRKPRPKPAAPPAGERDYSRPAPVIFYNADLGMVSPAVSGYWPRPVQELLRESEAMFITNFPSASCARFVGWYLAQPGTDGFYLGVHNVPVPPWNSDEAGRFGVRVEGMSMLFAVLEFTDFAIIAAIVAVLAGGTAAARSYFRPADRDRLARVEQKLDLLLTHAGLDYTPAPKAAWQELADEGPARKIAAIRAYREETGAGLAEAKRAVEEYIEGRRA